MVAMQTLDSDEIYENLKKQSERNRGVLPELAQIAWHAYVGTMFVHLNSLNPGDYEKFWDFFPNFDTDPDCNNPVLAMSIGKHSRRDPRIPPGGFIHQTKLEELVNDVEDELAHFSGQLPAGYVVALSGRFLGLRDCGEITDEEYKQLKALLPELKDNPVKEVEAFTRKYLEANRHQEVPPT